MAQLWPKPSLPVLLPVPISVCFTRSRFNTIDCWLVKASHLHSVPCWVNLVLTIPMELVPLAVGMVPLAMAMAAGSRAWILTSLLLWTALLDLMAW